MSLGENQFIRVRSVYYGTRFCLTEFVDFGDGSTLVEMYERTIEPHRLSDKKEAAVRQYVVCEAVEHLWAASVVRQTRAAVGDLVQAGFAKFGGKGQAAARVMRPLKK